MCVVCVVSVSDKKDKVFTQNYDNVTQSHKPFNSFSLQLPKNENVILWSISHIIYIGVEKDDYWNMWNLCMLMMIEC